MNFLKKYYGLIIGIIVLTSYLFGYLKYPISEEKADALAAYNYVNLHVSLAKILIYSILLLCLGFFAYNIYQNPKSGIKIGIGIAGMLALFFVAYLSSSDNPSELNLQDKVDASNYRMVGAMITLTMILLGAGISILVGLTIKNSINNGKA